MTNAVIVSTARTPLAKSWKGAFNMTHGATLGGHAVQHAVARAGIDAAEVEDVIMGCANPEGATGANIARQVALRAGLPITTSGMTVNRFCSSGLQTIAMASQRVIAGEGDIFVAGGVGTIWGVIAAVLIWGFSRSYLQLAGWDANGLIIVSGLLAVNVTASAGRVGATTTRLNADAGSITLSGSVLCQRFFGIERQLRSVRRCGLFFGFGLSTRLLGQGFVCSQCCSFFGGNHIGSGLLFSGLVQRLRQGVEQGRANVASHGHALACTFQQLPRQRGDGGFAVGACDGQHLGVIGHAGLQVTQGLCKQSQLGAHPQTSSHSGVPHRRH